MTRYGERNRRAIIIILLRCRRQTDDCIITYIPRMKNAHGFAVCIHRVNWKTGCTAEKYKISKILSRIGIDDSL